MSNINKELNKYLLQFISSLKNSKMCNKEDVLKNGMYDNLLFSLVDLEKNLVDDVMIMEKIYRYTYTLMNTYKKPIKIKTINFAVELDKIYNHCNSVALHMYFVYTHVGFGRLIMGSSAVKVGHNSYLYDPILDFESAINEIHYFLDEHNKNHLSN